MLWQLLDVMRLHPPELISSINVKSNRQIIEESSVRNITVTVDPDRSYWESQINLHDKNIRCILGSAEEQAIPVHWMIMLSLALVASVETDFGMIVHGGLIALNGKGCILAGAGGTGKTTACGRLPHPWEAFSDDATLVVRDERGVYWAHPWPTWSRFMNGGSGGQWSVEQSVLLHAICFLSQEQKTGLLPVGHGQATCLLLESAKQASYPMSEVIAGISAQELHQRRFDNACSLSEAVSCFNLSLNLSDPYWELLVPVLG